MADPQRDESREELIEATIATGEPGANPLNDPVPADKKPVAPDDPNPPERWQQDTQPVDGDVATNLPPETDLIQRQKVQG